MTETEARRVLDGVVTLHDDGAITSTVSAELFSWRPTEDAMCLDGDFTADQLEALAVLMRARRVPSEPLACAGCGAPIQGRDSQKMSEWLCACGRWTIICPDVEPPR